jgi:integrase
MKATKIRLVMRSRGTSIPPQSLPLATAQRKDAHSFGAQPGPTTYTLKQWLDEWLELCTSRGLRDSTVESYRTMLRLHVDQPLEARTLTNVTGSDLNSVYRQLLRGGRRDGRGGLSARTVRYLHTVLNRCFADAVRAGHLAVNPAAAADPPSPRAARPRIYPVWSPAELALFLVAARDDPLYPAFHLAAATGLRRGELLGLRWCDIDHQSCELHVVQAVVEVAHEARITPPKTERSRRLVALDRTTSEILARHRAAAEAINQDFDDQGLVFTSPKGGPIHPALFSYYFQRRVRVAGLRRIRLHDLRHTHATHALQAGVHPKIVSERLGHSTITVTLDTYSHVLPSMQREAAEAVAALMRA